LATKPASLRPLAYLAAGAPPAALLVVLTGPLLLTRGGAALGLGKWVSAGLSAALMLGGALLAARWGRVFGALDEQKRLVVLSTCGLIASGLAVAAVALAPAALPFYLAALLLASLAVPPSQALAAQAGPPSGRAVAPANKPAGAVIRRMLARDWAVIGGFLLCVVIAAGHWSDQLLGQPGAEGISLLGYLPGGLGFCLGCLVLLGAARLAKPPTLRLLYVLMPLLCVALLVVAWLLTGLEVASLGPFGSSFSLMVCGILLMARLSGELGLGVGPGVAIGPVMALTAAVFLGWLAAFPLMGWALGSVVDLVMKVAFLLAVAVQAAILAQRQPAQAAPAGPAALAEISAEMAGRYALSARESAVLAYLIQGRSAPYIAQQQFIATSTVKTHIRRIYQKTGVHSKQELLDLVHRRP
jgi:DNA-binding CsgD family transcriptional regulator